MAKTLIINEFDNGLRLTTRFPAEHAKALTFAAGVMDSKVTAYSEKGKTGSDSPVAAKMANLHIKQIQDGDVVKATYARLLVKASAKEDTIRTALAGKTIEGVRVDEVGVSFRKVDFS